MIYLSIRYWWMQWHYSNILTCLTKGQVSYLYMIGSSSINLLYPAIVWFWVLITRPVGSNKLQCYLVTSLKIIRTMLVSVIFRQFGRCFGLCDNAGSTQYTYIVVGSPCQRQCELLPWLGVRRLSSVKFSLKPLSQMNWNLVGSIYGRSSIKIAHFVLIH